MRWPTAALGDLCKINIGRTPSRSVPAFWEGGEHPWLSISDMGRTKEIRITKERITEAAIDACNMRPVDAGTVLFSFKLSIGKVGIASIPLFTNEAIASLPILDPGILCEGFLIHALEKVSQKLVGDRAAMGMTLNKASLAEIPIPLPPLEEQRRIAAILDKAGSLQQLSQSAIAKLHQTLESSFRRLSSITACNCGSKRLEEVVEAIIDYRGKSPEKTAEGIPLITARLIKEGRILEATEFIAHESYSEWMRRGMPKRGDVVFTTEAPLGQVAQIDNPDVALAQRLVLLRGNSKELDNTYLRFALRMNSVAEQIRKRATGSTVLGIRQKELRQIEIPLPTLEVQRDFAKLALAIEGEIQHLRQRADSVKALKDSLAKRLMEK